jgi:hypothetical protein
MLPAELERYLHEHIPLTRAMALGVVAITADAVILQAPLQPNINHRATVFGGSAGRLVTVARPPARRGHCQSACDPAQYHGVPTADCRAVQRARVAATARAVAGLYPDAGAQGQGEDHRPRAAEIRRSARGSIHGRVCRAARVRGVSAGCGVGPPPTPAARRWPRSLMSLAQYG